MRGRIVASLATALALAGAPATTQGPQAQNFAPEQLKTGGSLRAQLLAVPRRAHARPAGRRRLEEIPARRARALHRFGDARQEPDAALGRPAEARRGRGPVGLRGRGRENLIRRTSTHAAPVDPGPNAGGNAGRLLISRTNPGSRPRKSPPTAGCAPCCTTRRSGAPAAVRRAPAPPSARPCRPSGDSPRRCYRSGRAAPASRRACGR